MSAVVFQVFAESPGLLSGPVSVNSWRINFYFTILGEELVGRTNNPPGKLSKGWLWKLASVDVFTIKLLQARKGSGGSPPKYLTDTVYIFLSL